MGRTSGRTGDTELSILDISVPARETAGMHPPFSNPWERTVQASSILPANVRIHTNQTWNIHVFPTNSGVSEPMKWYVPLKQEGKGSRRDLRLAGRISAETKASDICDRERPKTSKERT
jgi:hypothetical protein